MNLADALHEEPGATPRAWCRVGLLRSQLDERDNAALTEAFNKIDSVDPNARKAGLSPYTLQWLRNILINNGHPIGSQSLRRHMKGECACGNL